MKMKMGVKEARGGERERARERCADAVMGRQASGGGQLFLSMGFGFIVAFLLRL